MMEPESWEQRRDAFLARDEEYAVLVGLYEHDRVIALRGEVVSAIRELRTMFAAFTPAEQDHLIAELEERTASDIAALRREHVEGLEDFSMDEFLPGFQKRRLTSTDDPEEEIPVY